MDALNVLAIEAEPYRLEVVEARWVRDRMKARATDARTLASAEALVAAAEASYEPYRLHVECATAIRVAGDKERALEDWLALPEPMNQEERADRETRIRFAESQLEGAKRVAEELKAAVAAHPEASKRALITGEVSMLERV